MSQSFSNAVNASPIPKQLVITCDWQGTLKDGRWHNIDLLLFLSDAKKAGHRVILTSGSTMEYMRDMLSLIISAEHGRHPDLTPADQFELISKSDLKELKLPINYAFDNKAIAQQRVANYAGAAAEIRVTKDATYPMSLAQLRERCSLPLRDKVLAPSSAAVPASISPPAPI